MILSPFEKGGKVGNLRLRPPHGLRGRRPAGAEHAVPRREELGGGLRTSVHGEVKRVGPTITKVVLWFILFQDLFLK